MHARKLSLLTLAVAGLVASGFASAQTRTYNFSDRDLGSTAPTGGCNVSPSTSGGFTGAIGNSVGCRELGNTGAATLNVSAWSSDGTSSTYRTAAVNDQGSNGFGVWNQTEGVGSSPPGHAADNVTPGVDLWRLDFTTAQALRSVTIGWAGQDGDFQVLRWGGSGAAAAVNGRTATQLLSDGWVLMSTGVGSDNVFNGLGAGVVSSCSNTTWTCNGTDQTFNFNTAADSSTAWLISAYNSAWTGTGATSIGSDAIKVLGVTTSPGRVSAPGTLALAGLGLLGAAFLRRRA